MAGFELDPGETVYVDTNRYTLQGNKVKFPVYCRCILTSKRFVFFDMGKMAPFHFQLGFLLRLMVKGKPVSLPLRDLKLSRGRYAKNSKILSLSTSDGKEIFLDRYEKSLEWFREALVQNGIGLSQTAEEEWRVSF